MAKTNLKRMNRFDLLELMYRLVVENEDLSRRCAELERQLNYGSRGEEYCTARESSRDYYDEPRTTSRRDEILARLDEQSSVPRTRREADAPSSRASPARRAASAQSARSASVPRQASAPAPAARRATQPPEEESTPTSVRRSSSPAARPQQRPAAQPKAPPARPAAQAQSAPRAAVKPAKMPPEDDFDIDSILEDYFSDLAFDGKGRDA